MWLDLCWFHWMCWWGFTCYVDHVWIMQHTHTCLRYPIPGLSIDSALPYPTLPRGPPLATLAQNKHTTFKHLQSFGQPETCDIFVTTRNPRNHVGVGFWKVTQILKSYVYFWCPNQIPTSNSKITSNSQILPQNPKSCLKIPNLASKS